MLSPVITDLNELIIETVEMMQYQAQLRNITIKCKPDDTLGSFMLDGQRVIQILLNLISNAVKFSPENQNILVDVFVIDDDED